MNEDICERNQHQKEAGKSRLAYFFQKMSSGNILGALYQKLPTGGKIQTLVDCHHKISQEGVRSNRQICFWEDIFIKDNLYSLSFNCIFLSH